VSYIEMALLLFLLHSKALESMHAESTSLKETQPEQSLSSQKQSICEETGYKIPCPEHINVLLLGVICDFTNDVLYTLKCCLKAYCIHVTTLTENLVIKILAPLAKALLQGGSTVHVAPACAGSREGSDHFGCYVHSFSQEQKKKEHVHSEIYRKKYKNI
jgi:hypothetical protein